jgi:hypothetical protein
MVLNHLLFGLPGSHRPRGAYNGTVNQLFIDSRKPMIQLRGKYYTVLPLSLEYPGN